MALKEKIEYLKNRYFRKTLAHPNGDICHHGDCKIYRSKKIYGFSPCTCGLLHDLSIVDGIVVEIIYPKYWDEDVSSDMSFEDEQDFIETTRKIQNNKDQIVQDIFEIFGDLLVEWNIIKEVFGQDYYNRVKKEYNERNNKTI